MKQKFLVGLSLLAIAGLWTGCSNEEAAAPPTPSNGKQPISFRMQGGMPESRATGTELKHVDAFVVYGTDDVAITDGADNIFEAVTVARQTNNTFDYNPKRYYSVGAASANFVAHSPVNAKVTDSTTVFPSGVSFKYEVVEPDNSGNTTQEDLLIAGTGVVTASPTIHFDFQHALSRIFVKATNSLSETVIITGLTLKNLYSKGTISGTVPGTPPGAWTWEWAPIADSKIDYSYILADNGVAVKPAADKDNPTAILVTSMEQGMMVLPQVTVNEDPAAVFDETTDFALEVTYDVANLKNQTAYIMLTDEYEFKMSNQYAITVAFDGDATNLVEISFTIDVDDFEDITELPETP